MQLTQYTSRLVRYYTNKKNGFATWTKPVALGTNEIIVEDKWERVEQVT